MTGIKAVIAAESDEMKVSLSQMCQEAEINSITVTNGGNLKKLFLGENWDIALAVLPFADEFGAECVSYLSRSYDAKMIVLSPSKVYDELCGRLSKTGVLILPKSAPRSMTVNAIRSAVHDVARLDLIKAENKVLSDTVNEMKLVNRAKCVLIEYLRITEKEAHRQMQKRAMDKRITLSEAAADILKTYEYK